MQMMLFAMRTFGCFVFLIILCVFYCAAPACAIAVVGKGNTATERTTDVTLLCDVSGLHSDDEIVRVTWYAIDKSHGTLTEIFSADLTNDQPAFVFSSNWAGRGTFDSTSLASIRLPSRYVTRDFSGKYRCEVNSLMSLGFDDVIVNVLYGPQSSIVITPGGRIEMREGEELTLTCYAQCIPECSYRWYKAGRQLSNSGVMTMTPLARDNAGLYACQARNVVGRSIKPVDLRVSFPATLSALNITGVSSDPQGGVKANGQAMVESNDSVVLTCEVKAWPEPTIVWSKSSVYNVATGNNNVITTTQVDLELKSSKYEIKSANCLDNAEYTCKASNNVGTSFKTVALNMSCAPFETNHSKNCKTSNEVKVIKNLKEILRLNVCFFGNPTPEVTLAHTNEMNRVLTAYKGNVMCDFKINNCESVFDINIASPDQYGLYWVKVSNSQGHFEKRYILSSEQPPLLPSMFTVSNISQNSACFSWKSNYNGGAKQTFELKVYATNMIRQVSEERVQSKELFVDEDESSTTSSDNFPEYSVCVINLHLSIQYQAVLTATNRFGISESLKSYTFTTLTSTNNTIQIPSWLAVVKKTTSMLIGEKVTHSPTKETLKDSNKIGQLLLWRDTTTKNPKFGVDDVSSTQSFEDKDVENKIDLLSSVDSSANTFSQFFDAYFTVNTLKKYNPLTSRNKSVISSSNYTSNFERLFLNYANANNQGFMAESMTDSDRETILDVSITSSDIVLNTPLPIPLDEPVATPSSMSPVSVSTICAVAVGILGIIITFSCIGLFKIQNRRINCLQQFRQRNGGTKTPDPTGSSLRSNSCRQPTANRDAPHPVSSITCVYNENASFSPAPSRRPRLSTPTILRTKEKPSMSTPREEHQPEASTILQCGLPTITLEGTRGSCPSYLELYHVEDDSPLKTSKRHLPDNNIESQLLHPHYLRISSRRSSYSSLHPNYDTSLSDEESDLSTSYLDLYETLTIRSRSRSPSNIYNPLTFDTANTDLLTCIAESVQKVQLGKQDSKIEEGNVLKQIVFCPSDMVTRQITAAYKDNQFGTEGIHIRHKNTPPRLNRKLNSSPDIPAYKRAPLGCSYELHSSVSRKHLGSNVYLPMTSEVNPAYVMSSKSCQNSEPALSLQSETDTCETNKKRNVNCAVHLNVHTFNKKKENKYDSRIPGEFTTKVHQQRQAFVLETAKNVHYVDTNEFTCDKKANVRKDEYLNSQTKIRYPRRDIVIDGKLTNKDGNLEVKGKTKYSDKEAECRTKHGGEAVKDKDSEIKFEVDTKNCNTECKREAKHGDLRVKGKRINADVKVKSKNLNQRVKNREVKAKTRDITLASKTTGKSDIFEVNGYVQENSISALARASTSVMSTSSDSVHGNNLETRNSAKSNFDRGFDESRSRKSSSESEDDFKSEIIVNFETNSNLSSSDCGLYDGFRVDNNASVKDGRDSGVSLNYTRESGSYNAEAIYSQISVRRSNRCRFAAEDLTEPLGSELVLYEEPVSTDHVYAELSH